MWVYHNGAHIFAKTFVFHSVIWPNSVRSFGQSDATEITLGDVEESGILITIDEITAEKHQRYIDSVLEA